MKIMKMIPLLATLSLVTSCGTESETTTGTATASKDTVISPLSTKDSDATASYQPVYPDDVDKSTYYQLLVYSFADGNGDGIGDFKGIVDKLDYLADLGIGGIWLSPINTCRSYHAYDVIDYESINPSYEVTVGGVRYDLDKLLEECHKRDIKVLMDMVLNHTSRSHKWYREHPSWYSGEDAFSGDMADLDYDNTEVRTAVKNVCQSYLRRGVDGFRLDAALWIYNKGQAGRGTHDDVKNIAWWKEFASFMKSVKSDAYIIGEVLDDNTSYARAYQEAIETFDFERTRNLYSCIAEDKAYQYASYVEDYKSYITSKRSDALGAGVISNHDIGRFTCSHSANSFGSYAVTSEADIKYALALQILSPGNSFLYYGDELGLQASCPSGYTDMSFRTPMPFGSERTDSVKYFGGFHGTGVTSSTTFDGSSIESMQADASSIYNVAKSAIRFKNENPMFTYNWSVRQIKTQDSSVGALEIYDGKGNGDYGMFFNSSDTEAVLDCIYPDPDCYPFDVIASFGNGVGSVSKQKLTVPSKSVVITRLAPTSIDSMADYSI